MSSEKDPEKSKKSTGEDHKVIQPMSKGDTQRQGLDTKPSCPPQRKPPHSRLFLLRSPQPLITLLAEVEDVRMMGSFLDTEFQVPGGHSSRDAPGSGMCKSEAEEWGLASPQTSWVLSPSSGQDTTVPSSALDILLQEEQWVWLQFGWLLSKILKWSSLKDLGWFWQGCTWVLTHPHPPPNVVRITAGRVGDGPRI